MYGVTINLLTAALRSLFFIKKSYNVINEALGRQLRNNGIAEITVNDNTFNNKVEVANAFNEYFSEIGTSLAGNFIDSTNYLLYMTNLPIPQRDFEFTPSTLR